MALNPARHSALKIKNKNALRECMRAGGKVCGGALCGLAFMERVLVEESFVLNERLHCHCNRRPHPGFRSRERLHYLPQLLHTFQLFNLLLPLFRRAKRYSLCKSRSLQAYMHSHQWVLYSNWELQAFNQVPFGVDDGSYIVINIK